MNIFDPSATGIWVDVVCLLLCIGLIIWEFKKGGEAELDIPQATEAAKEELASLKEEIEKARAESSGLKALPAGDDKKSAAKDADIKRLNAQLAYALKQQELSEKKLTQLKETEKVREATGAELDMLKARAVQGNEALAAKDAEIKRINAQLADALKERELSENKFKEQLSGMAAEQKKAEDQLTEAKKADSDAEWYRAEVEKYKHSADELRVELSRLESGSLSVNDALAAKDAEIKRINAQLVDMRDGQESSEKNFAKLKELQKTHDATEAELLNARTAADMAKAELETLKARSDDGAGELAAKDAEIKRLNAQLANALKEQQLSENKFKDQLAVIVAQRELFEKKLTDEKKADSLSLKEALAAKDAEIKRLKEKLAAVQEEQKEIAAKDADIERLKTQLADMQRLQEASEKRLAQYKKIGSDIELLEGEAEECRKSSHDMKRRIEEDRMKMRLLSEKSKENVELIATFAAGKEFDDFRKSIHLDELVQKYEDEIKELRIKNMDLEKRAG